MRRLQSNKRGKKRSRIAAREAKAKQSKEKKPAIAANGVKTRVAGKLVKKPAPPPPANDDSDVDTDSDDSAEDSDIMDAGLEDMHITGLDALGSASEDDEFDDDTDVMDSDEEVKRIGMWSDDEDEDEVEEKLTAANIEGLSRKLDMQKAIEDAEAQAELEESNMQTNIIGDKPRGPG